MKRNQVWILLPFLLIVGCTKPEPTVPTPSEKLEPTIPFPESIKIILPSADLDPEIAAFSGIWEGSWGGGFLPSRLAVEKIDSDKAQVVYAWADHPYGDFKGGWQRFIAGVYPGGEREFARLEFGTAVHFTFSMDPNLQKIYGVREAGQERHIVTMTRKNP